MGNTIQTVFITGSQWPRPERTHSRSPADFPAKVDLFLKIMSVSTEKLRLYPPIRASTAASGPRTRKSRSPKTVRPERRAARKACGPRRPTRKRQIRCIRRFFSACFLIRRRVRNQESNDRSLPRAIRSGRPRTAGPAPARCGSRCGPFRCRLRGRYRRRE